MRFNRELVEFFGNLVCSAFLDVFFENKQPWIVFQFSINDLQAQDIEKVPGAVVPTAEQRKVKQNLRMILTDNTQHVMTKEQISDRIAALAANPKDGGFSYTSGGLRIVVMREDVQFNLAPFAPFGTGSG